VFGALSGYGRAVAAGTVIFLNGASSSGKGTLARALQASLDRMFLHVEMDFVFVAMENAGYNGAVPLGETIPSSWWEPANATRPAAAAATA